MSQGHQEFSDAIEQGDLSKATECLHDNPELVNHPNWTPPPLHCAIIWNQPHVLELLLDHGADIEMLDPDRQTTPLRYAIMYCKPKCVSILLERGANYHALSDGSTSAWKLANDAMAGKYAQYDDLPRPDKYAKIVELLQVRGITD